MCFSAGEIDSIGYIYDVANRRTQMNLPDGTKWLYGYDRLSQVVSGERVDAQDRLVSATKGTTRLEFAYDYLGRRFEKKVYESNVLVRHQLFVYDGFKQIAEYDALNQNSLANTYLWQPVGLDVPLLRNGSEFYVSDANKNIVALLDTTGSVTDTYTYEPFGNCTHTGTSTNPFRFSSEYFDEETELVYYNYRYYSPEVGRWLSRDLIEEKGGINLYCFGSNNFLLYTDYLGLLGSSFDETKPERQCERNGVLLSLIFDGQTLSGPGFSVPAVSGKPIRTVTTSQIDNFVFITRITNYSKYTFDYSKEKQDAVGVGPIPEGIYWFSVDNKRSKQTSEWSHIIRYSSWGNYSWSLHNESTTETYGRKGFFIHGGVSWGSAGCIDIKNGDVLLSEYLDGLCKCFVPVKIKNAVKENVVEERNIEVINTLLLPL